MKFLDLYHLRKDLCYRLHIRQTLLDFFHSKLIPLCVWIMSKRSFIRILFFKLIKHFLGRHMDSLINAGYANYVKLKKIERRASILMSTLRTIYKIGKTKHKIINYLCQRLESKINNNPKLYKVTRARVLLL